MQRQLVLGCAAQLSREERLEKLKLLLLVLENTLFQKFYHQKDEAFSELKRYRQITSDVGPQITHALESVAKIFNNVRISAMRQAFYQFQFKDYVRKIIKMETQLDTLVQHTYRRNIARVYLEKQLANGIIKLQQALAQRHFFPIRKVRCFTRWQQLIVRNFLNCQHDQVRIGHQAWFRALMRKIKRRIDLKNQILVIKGFYAIAQKAKSTYQQQLILQNIKQQAEQENSYPTRQLQLENKNNNNIERKHTQIHQLRRILNKYQIFQQKMVNENNFRQKARALHNFHRHSNVDRWSYAQKFKYLSKMRIKYQILVKSVLWHWRTHGKEFQQANSISQNHKNNLNSNMIQNEVKETDLEIRSIDVQLLRQREIAARATVLALAVHNVAKNHLQRIFIILREGVWLNKLRNQVPSMIQFSELNHQTDSFQQDQYSNGHFNKNRRQITGGGGGGGGGGSKHRGVLLLLLLQRIINRRQKTLVEDAFQGLILNSKQESNKATIQKKSHQTTIINNMINNQAIVAQRLEEKINREQQKVQHKTGAFKIIRIMMSHQPFTLLLENNDTQIDQQKQKLTKCLQKWRNVASIHRKKLDLARQVTQSELQRKWLQERYTQLTQQNNELLEIQNLENSKDESRWRLTALEGHTMGDYDSQHRTQNDDASSTSFNKRANKINIIIVSENDIATSPNQENDSSGDEDFDVAKYEIDLNLDKIFQEPQFDQNDFNQEIDLIEASNMKLRSKIYNLERKRKREREFFLAQKSFLLEQIEQLKARKIQAENDYRYSMPLRREL